MAEPAIPERRHSHDSGQSETFKTLRRLSARVVQGGGAQEPQAAGKEPSRHPCLCCRRKPPPFSQTLVILRHSERRDYVDRHYGETEEGKAWPNDAPLTERGIELAREVAEELFALHKQVEFAAIATSPYRRCIQTAAEVAKRLKLPLVIDQEIGEVRDHHMPEDRPAHRDPKQLLEMVNSMGLHLLNPEENSGVKLFGKEPKWPEDLEMAKNRYVVRIETYIRQSQETQQNVLLVTHADAVAAALEMFQRGGIDIQNMGFCARVVARRRVAPTKNAKQEHGVYAEHWSVEYEGLGAEVFHDDALAKYHERMYLETCAEKELMVVNRKKDRTNTDMLFDKAMLGLNKSQGEQPKLVEASEQEELA